MAPAFLAVPFGLTVGLLLGLVGGGGSILAVPVLVYVLGQDVKEATTASLLIVGTTALAGAVAHARCGRVRVRTALPFAAAGAIGALAGTALNRLASPETILVLFALVLLAAAYGLVRQPNRESHAGTVAHGRALWLAVVPAGLGVGVLTGFFGVGGGFLVLPALVLLLGLPMRAAVGTSLLVIAVTSAVAFTAHVTTGRLDWAVAAVFTAAGVVGAVAGSRLVGRIPGARLRQGFAVLVAAVGVFVLAESAVGMF